MPYLLVFVCHGKQNENLNDQTQDFIIAHALPPFCVEKAPLEAIFFSVFLIVDKTPQVAY